MTVSFCVNKNYAHRYIETDFKIKMTRIIGLSGKGGTGKTTFTALILKGLIDRGEKDILVIDADPNECLADVLDVKEYTRLSDMIKSYEGKTINPVDFEMKFKSMLMENEQDNFDFIVMGRGEGKGCYCLINNLLKNSFEKSVLEGGFAYNHVIMDCEAGIEHISRKTSSSIKDLIIITDASKMGLETIQRVKDVTDEVEAEVENFYVIANKVQAEKISGRIAGKAKELGMTYLGNIPLDPVIEEYNFEGKSLLELPSDSKALKKVGEMLDTILSN
ncbi:MAG: P-loop NTPase [Candidatus Hydrothermarchaeales archaeon]